MLAFIPCSDGMSCIDNTEQSSHDHSDHEDHCTPFCTCTCCGSVVTVPASYIDLKGESDLSLLYQFPYVFDYSFIYSSNVWHPPILS